MFFTSQQTIGVCTELVIFEEPLGWYLGLRVVVVVFETLLHNGVLGEVHETLDEGVVVRVALQTAQVLLDALVDSDLLDDAQVVGVLQGLLAGGS